MRPIFTEGFVRQYQRLPQSFQNRFDRVLALLLTNLRHPSLRARKMEGEHDPDGREIWEARISHGYRFTFVIDKNTEAILFYRIGPHDIERRPR